MNILSSSHRWTLLLLVILCSASASGQSTAPRHALLWEISAPGLNQRSYLYGTFHVRDKRAFHFTDSTLLAIENCDYFALELDPDSLIGLLMNQYTGSGDKENLPVGKAEIRLSEYWDEWSVERLREQEMDEKEQQDYPTFVDLYLYEIARFNGKKTAGIEKMEAQARLMNTISQGHSSYPAGRLFADMIGAYEKGDIEALGRIMSYSDEFTREKVLKERNYNMADSIAKLVLTRRCFIAVGSGHLPGKEGVIELLRKKGYTLRPVTATWNGYLDKYENFRPDVHWEEYALHRGTLHVKLPHKPLETDMLGVIDFSFSMDYFRETYYMSFFTPYGDELDEDARQKLLKDASDGIGLRLQNLGAEQSGVTADGFPWRELHYDEDYGTYWVKLVATDYGLTVLMTGTTRSWTDEDFELATTYLESSTFHAPQQKGDQEFNDVRGGFSFTLPAFTPRKVLRERMEDSYDEYLQTTMYTSVDIANQRTIVVGYYDYPIQFIESQREQILYNLSYYVQESYLSPRGIQIDTIEMQGFPGLEISGYAPGEGIYTRVRYYLRGNRPYFVIISTAKKSMLRDENVERFLESLRFDSYTPYTWENHADTLLGFSLQVPSALEPLAEDKVPLDLYLRPFVDSTLGWRSADTVSLYTYYLFRSRLSPYAYIENPDSFLLHHINTYRTPGDTLLSSLFYSSGHMRSGEFVVQRPGDPLLSYYHIGLNGDVLLEQYVEAEDDAYMQQMTHRYFNSLQCSAPNPVTLTEPKAGMLLEDYFSSDSLRQLRASQILYHYPFTDNDFDILRSYLTAPHPEDTSLRSVSNLLGLLHNFSDSLALPFIQDIYEQDAFVSLRMDILDALAERHSVSGMKQLGQCLLRHIPGPAVFPGLSLYLLPGDTLSRHLIPYLEQLPADTQILHFPVLAILAGALDSQWVKPAERAPLSKWLPLCQALSETNPDQRVGMLWMNYQYMPSILAAEGSRDAIRILQKMAFGKPAYENLKALIMLLRIGQKVSNSQIKKYAASTFLRLELYRQLQQENLLERMPANYRSVEMLAASLLSEQLGYEDAEPDNVEFLRTFTYTEPGKEGHYLMYRFSWNPWEKGAKKEWYIGMIGPMPMDGATFDPNAAAFTLYELEESKPLEEHFRTLLQ